MSEAFLLDNLYTTAESYGHIALDTEFSIFLIQGPDAERYLHARTTQNIKALAEHAQAKALILSAQGKIFGAFSVLRKSTDAFYLLTHGKADESFLEELLRFKVADRFACREIIADCFLLCNAKQQLEAIFGTLPQSDELFIEEATSQSLLVPLQLRNGLSYIVISQSFELSTKLKSTPSAPLASFHWQRIQSLIPWMAHDITSKTSGTEIHYQDYISFTKGCYTGQEVVEMSTARGRPNYKLIQVSGKQDAAPTSGAALNDPASSKEIGFVTRGVFIPNTQTFLSLGFVKSNVEIGSQLLLNGTPLSVKQDV